jgi:catechol 2,3-dioxygenase-like lactoylglutathione lyase family enzyme
MNSRQTIAVSAAELSARGHAFRIKSIDHTGFTVSSLDESLRFWVDVMGFRHLYTWTFETEPFIEQLVGVPGAAMRLAMVEGPGHSIELRIGRHISRGAKQVSYSPPPSHTASRSTSALASCADPARRHRTAAALQHRY